MRALRWTGTLLLAASAAAADITVINPNGNDNFSAGGVFSRWTSLVAGTVDLQLWKGGSYLLTMATGQPASGNYTYTLPQDIQLGEDYTVHALLSTGASDTSDAPFRISTPGYDFSVPLSATVQVSPPQVTLTWGPTGANSTFTSYDVYRRMPGDASWGSSLATLAGTATDWTDASVTAGSSWEYRVHRAGGSNGSAEGFLLAAIDTPITESRGTVVLAIEATMATALAPEIERLEADLVGDGWTVATVTAAAVQVGAAAYPAAVTSLKAQIKAIYDGDPSRVKQVFLLGNLPVPYSGNIAPDGHGTHAGAWPADVYYGTFAETWTDTSVNVPTSGMPANINIPGDGKFDQSYLTATAELGVGRVDLSRMPAFVNSGNETALLRAYLAKDHAFRCRQRVFPALALIDDSWRHPEGFTATGWRAFPTLVGRANVIPNDWNPTLSTTPHLLAYGMGAGGNTGVSGVTTTAETQQYRPQAAFTSLFGSFFGDWDPPDNVLRGMLGPGDGLVCTWSGRPIWQMHLLATGATWGEVQRLNVNATFSSYPNSGYYQRMVHIALMGDPTLRLHPVAMPGGLVARGAAGSVQLRWTAAADAAVIGYHVYRAATAAGPFTRLTGAAANAANPSGSPLAALSYTDSAVTNGNRYTYLVRSVKRELTPSGTYWNLSEGAMATATAGSATPYAPTALTVQADSRTAYTLSWLDQSTDETSFVVERSAGSMGAWSVVATLAANTTSWSDSGLTAGTNYWYRVRAANLAGQSAAVGPAGDTGTPGVLSMAANFVTQDRIGSSVSITVQRTGGDVDTVQCSYADTAMTALAGIDYLPVTGTLTWGHRDSTPRTITIQLPPGPAPRLDSAFKITIALPTNGAVLGTLPWTTALLINSDADPLPAGWSTAMLSGQTASGAVRWDGSAFSISSEVYGALDTARYAYRSVIGDFDVRMRVLRMDKTNDIGSTCSIMVRADTTNTAIAVGARMATNGAVIEQRRTTTGGSITNGPFGTGSALPVWLRILRSAGSITTYRSSNGVTWTQVQTGADTLPAMALVGFTASGMNVPGIVIVDQVQVLAPGTTPPTAVLTAGNVIAAGGSTHAIQVTYADADNVDVASIATGDVRVTTTTGAVLTPTFSILDVAGNGSPRTATYLVPAPGGIWDASDNGTYTVELLDSAVQDVGGTATPGQILGTFQVAVPGGAAAPVITEGATAAVTMSEDGSPTAFALTLHATDADSPVLTWSVVNAAAHGAASTSGTGTSKAIIYIPTADWNGTDSFVVRVSDGVLSDDITVTVTVQARNDAPQCTVVPTVSGSAVVGQSLTSTSGTWNDVRDTAVGGSSTLSFTYQWSRADDSSGTNEVAIAGATSVTYMLQAADLGMWVRCTVTCTDTGVGMPANQTATAATAWISVVDPVSSGEIGGSKTCGLGGGLAGLAGLLLLARQRHRRHRNGFM